MSHGNLHAGSHWHNFAGGFARVAYSFGVGVLICRSRVKLPRAPSPLILMACAAVFFVDAGQYTGIYELVCVLVVLPGLVALGAANEPSERIRPHLAYLGLISYGVYSLHFPLALATKGFLTKIYGDDISALTPWIGIVFLSALIAVCGVIDKLYDKRIRSFLTSRLTPTKSQKHIAQVDTTKV